MKRPATKWISALLLIALLSALAVQPVIADNEDDNTTTIYVENRSDSDTDYAYRSSGVTTIKKEDTFVNWGERNHNNRSSSTTASNHTTSSNTSWAFTPSTKYPYASIQAKIREYQKTNDDVKGWLTIPGTNINEPILFSNVDNNYYVNRDWKGNVYPNNNWQNFVTTAAYADCRMQFGNSWGSTSRNTVLYGHNWTNLRDPLSIGSNNNHIMFGQLPSYTNLDFALTNPYIYYSTDQIEGIWKVFAVAYAEESTNFYYNSTHPTKENYAKLISEWKNRSLFDFDVDVNENDRILTLSTCTRVFPEAGEKQRYVVVARLLRTGESENDKVTATVNPDRKNPQF